MTVGAITTNGPADREGTLIQGDIIRAVEGEQCATIEEVTMCVIKGGISLKLAICRRPVSVVLESEVKMRMPDNSWEPFAFRLLSNRNIEFEKLSPPQYSGEIQARVAQSLNLLEDKGEQARPPARLEPVQNQRGPPHPKVARRAPKSLSLIHI